MLEDYKDLNVKETLAAVADFDGERLAEFLAYERECKNRKTVIEPLERQLVTVEATTQGYIGGQWFDETGERRTVRRTNRIDEALEDGGLREVS
jgi:hypothetical protein